MNFVNNRQRVLFGIVKQEFDKNELYTDESRYFEFFASKHILKSYNLSDEDVEGGILGGGNDGGCDAIYIFLNGNLVTDDYVEEIAPYKDATIDFIVVQAKRKNSFEEDAIMKWKEISENLLEIGIDNKKFMKRYNTGVLSAFSNFRDLYMKMASHNPKVNIYFNYATFAEDAHPNVRDLADKLLDSLRELIPCSQPKIIFWDAEKLLQANMMPHEENLRLHLAENPINIGIHTDFITLVNIAKYYNFITTNDNVLRKEIFEYNIRDYQGHNAVNQEIQKALANPSGEDFWWLNNGITLLTRAARLITNKEILLEEPSIVNGLQTSSEIYHFFSSHLEKLESEKRNILVRIIVPESEESRDRIILATNNQTTIPKASLRANDPIHWSIESYLKVKGLFYDRRKNFYKNQGKKSHEIVSVSFLAQCMISLLLQSPDYARARPSTLLSKDDIYKKLYNENIDIDVFYIAAKIGKTIETYLKRDVDLLPSQRNDILFYVIYFSVAKILNKAIITARDIKSLDLSNITDTYLSEIKNEVLEKYDRLGGNSKVAKGTELIEALKSIFQA